MRITLETIALCGSSTLPSVPPHPVSLTINALTVDKLQLTQKAKKFPNSSLYLTMVTLLTTLLQIQLFDQLQDDMMKLAPTVSHLQLDKSM